jgi:hypothetical protein
MIYIIVSVGMLIVAKIAYDQGHINGETKGRTDVLEEDLIRMDAVVPHDDLRVRMAALDMDTADESIELQQQIIAACEASRG